jgi:hypothetical protein
MNRDRGTPMGLVATMKVLPAAAFRRHKKDLTKLKNGTEGPSFELDKAWLEFHTALRKKPKPLSLAISGDSPAYGKVEGGLVRAADARPLTDEELEDESLDEEQDDFYLGYASPGLVTKLEKALAKLSEEDLFAAIKTAGWPCRKGDQKYYRFALDAMRKAYRAAAKKGDALEILIT